MARVLCAYSHNRNLHHRVRHIRMTFFDALETDDLRKPVLHPAIYVEPRDKDAASEDDRQAEFIATMRRTALACRVYAVPNGAKRSRWESAKVKREGLASGWPDTGTRWANGHADIEFKNGTAMPTPNQIETLNWLHLRGHHVAVCRTAAGAMRWLREVGAPVPIIA